MPSITQRTLNAIKPTGSVFFIRDSDLKGFAIKVSAKGQVSFIVEARIKKGPQFRMTLGTQDAMTLNDARSDAHMLLANAKRGIDPRYIRPIAKPASQTLRWCLEKHLDTFGIRKSTEKTYRNQINNVFKDWYNEPVEQITPDRILKRRIKLLRDGKTENYVASCLRTLKAVLNNSDLTSNPVTLAGKRGRFSVQSTPTSDEDFLREDKIVALLCEYAMSSNYGEPKYLPYGTYLGEPPKPNIFAAVLYLLLIGGREQDVYNLTWDMVDPKNKIITYPSRSRKEKQPHVIPMVGIIEDIVLQQPTHLLHPKLVFGMTHSMFTSRYTQCVKPLIHNSSKCLRKTWSEHMGLDGYDDKSIGRGLNHSWTMQGSVTSRSYFTGALVKEKYLQQMFLNIQARYIHYAFGNKVSDDVKEDLLANIKSQGQKGLKKFHYMNATEVMVHILLLKFPAFSASLKGKTTDGVLGDFEEVETILKAIGYT